MGGPTFPSAREKIRRADFHIDQLEELERGVWDAYPDAIRCEVDRYVSKQTGAEHAMVTVRSGWTLKFGSHDLNGSIGDAIHNLRSALDNLAWDLMIAARGKPPPEPLGIDSDFRKVQFPIWAKGPDWRRYGAPIRPPDHMPNDWGLGALYRVSEDQRAIIYGLQPFLAQNSSSLLWQLSELDNTDKHRHPNVSIAVVRVTRNKAFKEHGLKLAFHHQHKGAQSVKQNTKLAKVLASGPLGSWPDSEIENYVQMYLDLGVRIKFGKGPIQQGVPVVTRLREIRAEVARVVGLFLPRGERRP